MIKKTKVVAIAGLDDNAIKARVQRFGTRLKAEINAVGQKLKNNKPKFSDSGKIALLAFFLLAISSLNASAQKTVVLDALSKNGIDAAILDPNNFTLPVDYCYNLRQSTVATGKEKIIDAKFDPSGPNDEQWTVVSIDGKSPSKGDINTFRKNQNKPAPTRTDESSFRVEKETPDNLVVSSKIDAASAPKDAPFMKDCRSYMTINLKTKRVEQVLTINEKPVKIKIINVEKLNIVTKYKWDEQAKRYFTISQNLDMQGKFLGQSVPVQTTSEYSNYAKR
jgi:hypothetical protein